MELNPFIVKAKINTYACKSDIRAHCLPDGGKEFTFQEAGFEYRDRFYGSNPFAGEEIIWCDENVVWVMSCFGRVIGSAVPISEIIQFLKIALRLVREERPFRGPAYLKEIDFEYFDESQGEVDGFVGLERIFYKGEEVYRLDYLGGGISR